MKLAPAPGAAPSPGWSADCEQVQDGVRQALGQQRPDQPVHGHGSLPHALPGDPLSISRRVRRIGDAEGEREGGGVLGGVGAGCAVGVQAVHHHAVHPQAGADGFRECAGMAGVPDGRVLLAGEAAQPGRGDQGRVGLGVDGGLGGAVHVVAEPAGRRPVHDAVQVGAGAAAQFGDQSRRRAFRGEVPQRVVGGVAQVREQFPDQGEVSGPEVVFLGPLRHHERKIGDVPLPVAVGVDRVVAAAVLAGRSSSGPADQPNSRSACAV